MAATPDGAFAEVSDRPVRVLVRLRIIRKNGPCGRVIIDGQALWSLIVTISVSMSGNPVAEGDGLAAAWPEPAAWEEMEPAERSSSPAAMPIVRKPARRTRALRASGTRIVVI